MTIRTFHNFHSDRGSAYLATFLLESRLAGLCKNQTNRKIVSGSRPKDKRKQEAWVGEIAEHRHAAPCPRQAACTECPPCVQTPFVTVFIRSHHFIPTTSEETKQTTVPNQAPRLNPPADSTWVHITGYCHVPKCF